ncbi:MAG: RNA polymerase factor sigma-54 [Fibrobacterota bacterium]
MNINLSTSLSLSQKMSPQMIQSLKLLQVSTIQLEQMIKQELEINPVLEEEMEEIQEPEEGEIEEKKEDSEEPDDLKTDEEEVDWEEYLNEGFDLAPKQNEKKNSSERVYEKTAVAQPSIDEYLIEQLHEKKITQEILDICTYIIGNIDDNGYIRAENGEDPLEALSAKLEIDIRKAREALTIIQRLDPPGIGSRDLRECLLIQLRSRGIYKGTAYSILENCYEDFMAMKVQNVAKKLGISTADVQEALNLIGTLDPKPGLQISGGGSEVIIPDIIVEKDEDEFIVYLNDRSLPGLRINSTYKRLLERGSDASKDTKSFIREKLNSASWMIKSIEQRKNTMLKVMNSILEKQKKFFEKGPGNLRPMVLQEVADDIDMHISTVSRVTNDKYVQTPYGVFELKYFFSAGVAQDDNSVVSSESTKQLIREIVEGENPAKPLSDQAIVGKLKEKGVSVARRTVSKYREQLRILPARMRKKF